MASFVLASIRVLFGTIEHFAPHLAGRWAFALFCRTPNPEKMSTREREVIAAAAPFMAGAKRHFLASHAGRTVVAHEFKPLADHDRDQTALVIHGWQSRAEHMRGIVATLRDLGFRVVAIDLPGHGQSSGRSLTMVDAVAAVHAAEQRFGPFELIAGHSFGGAVAVNAVAGSIAGIAPVHAGRLALVSAPSSIPAVLSGFGDMIGLGPKTRKALDEQIEKIAGRPMASFVGAHQLAGTDIPALVIHAPDDKEVPVREARAYEAAGDNVRLFLADGLGHRRILADRQVLSRIASFALGEQRLALVG